MRRGLTISFILCLTLLLEASPGHALSAEEILLIVNQNVRESLQLAEYYQEQRGIPHDHLLSVSMTDSETCSREDYQQNLVQPLRRFLNNHPERNIRCLVLFYGIPLKVSAPKLSSSQWRRLEDLKYTRKRLEWQLQHRTLTPDQRRDREVSLARLGEQIKQLNSREEHAAVDSEVSLALVAHYSLERWIPNPFFVAAHRFGDVSTRVEKDQVLFVSRLDAPRPAIVRRMIADGLSAEQKGLRGNAYFDARWLLPGGNKLQGYALYDVSLHKAAEVTGRTSSLSVVLDQKETLFQPGEAPEAALYCGWYSLGRYIPAFDWQPGSVGYHIASSECTTLRTAESQGWCKRMLEEGAAATIGPVSEPYVQGFPLPELFFGFLLDGYYTLVESYFLSVPFLSWQMILVGDPLYRPFRHQFGTPFKEFESH
ncbi:MAG: TIGR03790 family protein [Desulfuromonadales bacterium]|nr:TIGR03790 family protein [Desulfuromonadales bacterium]MBN2792754.1 TIGR03790 family protein [Desulfuromonadales bacterium]